MRDQRDIAASNDLVTLQQLPTQAINRSRCEPIRGIGSIGRVGHRGAKILNHPRFSSSMSMASG